MLLIKTYTKYLKDEEYLNNILNHLFIIYLFLFPISDAHKSVFLVILLIFLIRGNFKKYFLYALSNPVIQALSIFALIHILWLFTTENLIYAKGIVRSSLYYLYPIIFITFLDYRYLSRYLFAFFLAMLVSEFFSYGLFFEIIPSSWGFYNNPADPSPFYHHTHYGMALAFTLSIIFFDLFTQKENKYIKIMLGGFFITASINLFINGGRTGYLLYLILLISMGFWFVKKYSYRLFLLIVPILIISFYLAYNYSGPFKKRLKDSSHELTTLVKSNNYASSFGSRVGAWKYSIPIIKEHLIFGVGTGNQLAAVQKYTKEYDPIYYRIFTAGAMVHLHNQYISVLVQFGLIGLSAYLFLLYRLFTYQQDNHLLKTIQVFLTLAIIFFGFIDILTEASALAILLFTTLVPITLLKNETRPLKKVYVVNQKTTFLYFVTAFLFYVIKLVT